VGKHFWPNFAFINGIRLDYLSPTIYLSDLLIFLLFAFTLLFHKSVLLKGLSNSFIFILFLFSLLLSSFLAKDPDISFFFSLRIIEMIFFGWYISQYKFSKISSNTLIDVLLFSAVIQSIISFFQFLLQRSINGPLYFLGERSFSVDTVGIATFFSQGNEILRPYGTFPHPNVLAFFLSIALILGASYISIGKRTKRSYFYILFVFLIFLSLLLTASRLIIILTLISSAIVVIKSKKHMLYLALLGLIVVPLYLTIFSGRFLLLSSFIEALKIRWELLTVNLQMFFTNPLFGVGINNTFLSNFNNTLPIFARFQPVHNVYIHILVQIGIFGIIPVIIFLEKIVIKMIKLVRNRRLFGFIISLLILELLIVSFFDHFPITLQQGMLMTALLLGMLFNRFTEQELE